MRYSRCNNNITIVFALTALCSASCQAFLGIKSSINPQRTRQHPKLQPHLKAKHGQNYLTSNRLLQTAEHFIKSTTSTETSRRLFFASSIFAAGTALAPEKASALKYAENTKLPWEATPVNKRTGRTLFDAENAGYNVRFVTYLSRFLLCFDEDCQRWWYNRAAELPRFASAEQVKAQRLAQFAAFSASVEVGLQEYLGPDGPKTLLRSLVKRYCPDMNQLRKEREDLGLPPLSESAEQKKEREIKEARRQIALLFGLMEKNQPTEDITKLLAAIDNGSIQSVEVVDGGSGYAPGYGPPEVRFPPPDAGEGYETARGRAVLEPVGRLLRIDVVNRGGGYTKAPTVTIAPPAAIRFDNNTDGASTAQAKAYIFRSGVNKGKIERIELTDPGAGYGSNEIIKVRISPPDLAPSEGGITATATAVREYAVARIDIINNGTGYAVEKPIEVYVEPPPLTARVNMNDPLMARIISPDQPLPPTTIPTKDMRKKMLDPSDPNSVAAKASFLAVNGGKGGAGGCIGRGCYDRPVKAIAYPRAEKDSYTRFQSEDEANKPQIIENSVGIRSASALPQRVVSGSISSMDAEATPELPSFGGVSSSSAELLKLLPAGIGLEYNSGRYSLAVDPDFKGLVKTSGFSKRAFDPDFGPRGRSPIEREMELGVSTYLRFIASGAICCSGVHLALTPIDVVKTKVQTNPEKYPGVIQGFKQVMKEGGVSSFFTGWAPTFVGFFLWGGLSYALTEYLRRVATSLAGADAGSLEVPIILTASALAAFVGSFVICPFEAVRIRSVAQPGYGKTIIDVLNRMVKEEGIETLFKAVPAFWLKEVPFAMGKFTVFDVSTAWMYDSFPAAREDIQLSLIVSLVGGTLGGMVAAVLSNPADTTISELKKAKSDMTPQQAAAIILDRDGSAGLFRGLPLRVVFYSLVVSLQFLVYDAVRLALGIGSDDLKLYLDVLGGALREKGGPI